MGFSRILSFKFPSNGLKMARPKFSPFLAFFLALFVHRWPRELCFWPPCPPSLSSFLLSSLLGGRLGFFSLLPRFVCARRRRRWTVLAASSFSFLSSFLLSPGRSPPLGLLSLFLASLSSNFCCLSSLLSCLSLLGSGLPLRPHERPL